MTMTVVRHPDDRRCTHTSDSDVRCITRLNRLNPGPDCYTHSTVAPPTRAVQEAVAFDEFKRLMGQHEGRIAA